jgi:hypothetical protein
MAIVLEVGPACTTHADRIRNGLPVKREITAVVTERHGSLPELHLFSDWSERRRDWRTRDTYEVEEIIPGVGYDGRAFLLHRDPASVAADAKRDPSDILSDRYGVFLAADGFNHHCECRGHLAHARCKHVDGLLAVIREGCLEDPRSIVPEQPHPSPEQLASDAKVDDPFNGDWIAEALAANVPSLEQIEAAFNKPATAESIVEAPF